MNWQHSQIASARTLLFVPGDRPERFSKAAASGADQIVLDLEDAVTPDRKAEARQNVQRWRTARGVGIVRINPPDSPWYEQDISMLKGRPSAVMLPKATGPGQVANVLHALAPGSCVIPLLETASGILTAPATCAVPGVVRAAFGNGDLASELGVENTNHMALDHARSAIVLASAAVGIAPPVDGVTTSIHDDDALRADTRHAAALGFTGKLCIHPCQISLVHTELAPSEDALHQARKVLATAVGESVTTLEGRMIDKPIIEHARRLISRHSSSANKPRHAVGES